MAEQASKYKLVPESEMPDTPEPEGSSGLQKVATGVRYGVPIGVSLIPGVGIPTAAATAGVAEFGAQKIEEYAETGDVQWTDLNTNLEDLVETGIAVGSEVLGMRYGGKALEYVGSKIKNSPFSIMKRMFIPPESAITEEGAIAGKVLNKMGSHASAAVLTEGKGSTAMFEDMLRSAFFSASKWVEFDKLNEDLVVNALSKYSDKLAATLPPSGWGELLTNLMIGSGKKLSIGQAGGELGFARSTRNVLYDAFRDLADEQGDRFSAKALEKFLKTEGNRAEVKAVMMEIGDHLRKTVTKADAGIEAELADMTPNLAKALRQAIGEDPNLGTMSPGDAVELRKLLNGILRDPNQPQAVKGVANHLLGGFVKPGLDEAIAKNPAAKKALEAADAFLGNSADLLENKITEAIYKEMIKSPDALFAYMTKAGAFSTGIVGGGKGGLSTLNALEAAFTKGHPTTLGRAQFETAVLKPMQTAYFRSAADSAGRLQGTKLVKLFQEGNEFAEKLFGGKEAVAEIRELAIALKLQQHIPKSSSIIMQLTQGGTVVRGLRRIPQSVGGLAMGGAAAGGYAAGGGAGAAVGAVGTGAVIFISPIVLSKWLTKPKTVAKIAKGVQLGPFSTAFAKATATLGAIGVSEAADYADIVKLGERAESFYSKVFEASAQPKGPPAGSYGSPMAMTQ